MTVAIIDNRGTRPVIIGAGAQVAGALVAEARSLRNESLAAQSAAEAARDDAQSAKDLAGAAALSLGNVYANTAAGLAATTDGDYFWTVDPANLYLNDSGSAVLQDELATTGRSLGAFTSPLIPDNATTKEVIEGLATNLKAASGSAEVGFAQTGTGAATRTVQAKLRDVVSAKDHGAVGDFSNNDTASLQATIDSLGLLGGEVEVSSSSRFLVTESGSTGACLNITRPVSLVGKGGLFSAISPSSSISSGVAAINFTPADVPGDFTRFENLVVGNPFNGTRGGGIGLHMVTSNSGITLGRILVEGVTVGTGGSTGFVHDNDDAANVTGGLFCAEFRRNLWMGGMRFGDGTNGTGDSLLCTSNTTTGAGYGVEFTGTIDEDGNTPSQAVFINHNSTSQEGSFLFHRANFPTIQNANQEQTVANSGGVLVNFLGDGKPNNSTGIRAPSFTNSLAAAFGGADLDALVNFGSCSGGICFNNWFLDGGGGAAADITISADAHDVWIGPNLTVLNDLRITDNGVGTRGVNKTLTLESSWVAAGDGSPAPYAWKGIDGDVTVSGGAKNGSTTPGAPVTIMPVGFRPAAIEIKHCLCLDNGTYSTAVVSFNPNGEVKIVFCPNAAGNTQRIFFNATYRAANANAIKVPTPYVV